MTMFNDGNRTLQDRYNGRAVADKIVELVETSTFNDEFKAFVESVPFFFLATSAGDNADCSFKGGEPGFVRVTAPDQLIFPDYDGNRMYKSLGNILQNPNVGLLFIKFGKEEGEGAMYLRLRISGKASIHDNHDALSSYAGAKRIVQVAVTHIFPNCPRYIPHMELVSPSRHIPKTDEEQPTPAWKNVPPIAELLDD